MRVISRTCAAGRVFWWSIETEISGSDYSCLVPELELRYARTDQIRMQI